MTTMSALRVMAASIASNATAAGSLPARPPTKSAPARSAHTRSWSMAPADYAKVLAAFAIGARNPLLNRATVDQMWTVPRLWTR